MRRLVPDAGRSDGTGLFTGVTVARFKVSTGEDRWSIAPATVAPAEQCWRRIAETVLPL